MFITLVKGDNNNSIDGQSSSKDLGATTLSITTLSITTLANNDIQHNDTQQHSGKALLCRVLFMLIVTFARCHI
jgi:hypothetical protein